MATKPRFFQSTRQRGAPVQRERDVPHVSRTAWQQLYEAALPMLPRIRLTCSVIVASFSIACVTPPPPPPQIAPISATSDLNPIDVVRRASATLVELGFDISVSDATGGVVQANRERRGTMTGGQNDPIPFIACSGTYAGFAEIHHVTKYTVSVSAIPRDGGGSTVTIRSRVVSEWPGVGEIVRPASSETDCASDGTVERQLATAISAK